MAFKVKHEDKPFEDVCCGAYCEEAGCCPFDYYSKDDQDSNTPDMFPDYYERPERRNPDLDGNQQ